MGAVQVPARLVSKCKVRVISYEVYDFMKTSDFMKEQMKRWEGLRLEAYRCPAGVLTIGYGHTGNDVSGSLKITEGVADLLFEQDVEKVERQVSSALGGTGVKQCQWDSLVSFAFNAGIGNLMKSTLLKKVRSYPDNPAIGDEFRKWVYGGGKVLPGLVKRRDWEARHYNGEL